MKGKKENIWNYIIIGLLVAAGIVLLSLIFTKKKCEGFSNNSKTLEYFYMPSCPHCKDFNPVWDDLEQQLTKENIAVGTQKHDLMQAGELGQKYGVNAAPTLLLVKEDGNWKEYKGPREVAAIMSFIKDELK
jgi:thioredoxin-related protein